MHLAVPQPADGAGVEQALGWWSLVGLLSPYCDLARG